jgi:hypothetical protein
MRINLDNYVGETVALTATIQSNGKYSGNLYHDGMLIGSVSGTADDTLREHLPKAGVLAETVELIKGSANRHSVRFEHGSEIEVFPLRMS